MEAPVSSKLMLLVELGSRLLWNVCGRPMPKPGGYAVCRGKARRSTRLRVLLPSRIGVMAAGESEQASKQSCARWA